MNWFAFSVFAWISLGLELGLRDTLRIGPTAIAPSFVIPLGVIVAMSATPRTAIWACLLLGLLLDLTWIPATTDPTLAPTIIGPYALGFALAAQFVVTIRGITIRKNPLTAVALTIFASVILHLVVVSLFSFRAIFDETLFWHGSKQLLERLGASLYSGLTAFFMALVLLPLSGVLGFGTKDGRRPIRKAV